MSERNPSPAAIAGQQYLDHEAKKAHHVHRKIIHPKPVETNPLKGFLEQELRKDLAPIVGNSDVLKNPQIVNKISSLAEKQYESKMEYSNRIEEAKEEARELMYDGLTKESKVYTRHSGDVAFLTAINDAIRNHQGIGLLMVDHDWFKSVNDQYGHPAGDLVIQEMAATLRQLLQRRNDFIIRYGGEEFAVVLPAITPKVLRQKADLIEPTYDKRQEALRGPKNPVFDKPRKISRGITYLAPDDPRIKGKTNGEISKLLYAEADDALLAAKEMGRNQTQNYSEIDERFKKNTLTKVD
jgi:diguanylate cyclase (GGDEF)-like protein